MQSYVRSILYPYPWRGTIQIRFDIIDLTCVTASRHAERRFGREKGQTKTANTMENKLFAWCPEMVVAVPPMTFESNYTDASLYSHLFLIRARHIADNGLNPKCQQCDPFWRRQRDREPKTPNEIWSFLLAPNSIKSSFNQIIMCSVHVIAIEKRINRDGRRCRKGNSTDPLSSSGFNFYSDVFICL